MRVLFLTLYPGIAASPRYRVAQFLPHLRAAGIACDVSPAVSEEQYTRLAGPGRRGRAFWYHAAETPRRVAALLGAARYDVVFVQKALASAYVRGLDTLLRARARRVVYDIDDAVHLFPPHSLRGVWKALENPRQIRRLMARAGVVLAGNRWLVAETEREGGRAELFPTVVDTERFAPSARPPETFRIGWVGGPSTTPSLQYAPGRLGPHRGRGGLARRGGPGPGPLGERPRRCVERRQRGRAAAIPLGRHHAAAQDRMGARQMRPQGVAVHGLRRALHRHAVRRGARHHPPRRERPVCGFAARMARLRRASSRPPRSAPGWVKRRGPPSSGTTR